MSPLWIVLIDWLTIDLATRNYNRATIWKSHDVDIAIVFKMSQNIVLTKTLALLFRVLKGEAHSRVGILKRRIKSSYDSVLLLLYKGQDSYHRGKWFFSPLAILSFSFSSQQQLVVVFCLFLHYTLLNPPKISMYTNKMLILVYKYQLYYPLWTH